MTEKISHGQNSWSSGEKRGEGAAERMGDWTQDIVETPDNKYPTEHKPKRSEDDPSITRREFLKKGAIITAGATILATLGKKGVEHVVDLGEEDLRQKTEVLKNNVIFLKVPQGAGIDYFYHQSGWNVGEGSINASDYREIVKRINGLSEASLKEGSSIRVPIREGSTLEIGN